MQAAAALAQVDHVFQHQHGKAMHRAPHRQAQRAVMQRLADLFADGIGLQAQRRELVAVGQLAAEHQPGQRRTRRNKPHIGRTQGRNPVGFGARRLGCLAQLLAQLLEALDGKLHQQRLVIGEVAIGRGMADAGLARHRPQRQRRQRLLFQDAACSLQKTVAQIAVMIGTARPTLRHCRGSGVPLVIHKSKPL